MVACVPIYPYSCHPDDMMYSVEAMHDRYLFGDVHVRGEYPSYIKKNGNEKIIISRSRRKMSGSCAREPWTTSDSAIT